MINIDLICDGCAKKFDTKLLTMTCAICEDVYRAELGKLLLDYLFTKDHILSGKGIAGFNSKEEKELFLSGQRSGFLSATYHVMEFMDLRALSDLWEILSNKFEEKPIEAHFDPGEYKLRERMKLVTESLL